MVDHEAAAGGRRDALGGHRPRDAGGGRARRARRRRVLRVLSVMSGALVLGTVLVGCGSTGAGPQAAVSDFVSALGRRDYAAMAAVTGTPRAELAAAYGSMWRQLHLSAASFGAGTVVTRGSSASAPLTSRLSVPGYGTVPLRSTLRLQRHAGRWLVEWSPATVDSRLGPGDRFTVATTWAARAPVLGANGASLTPPGVSVGLVGQRITDPAQLTAILLAAGFDASTVSSALQSAQAHPTQLVPVGTIPRSTYETLKAQPGTNLYSVGGTAFSSGTQVALSADLGAHLVGTVGPITAEQLRQLGGPYAAGDLVGQTGIEGAYERRLAGSPGVTIAIVGRSGGVVATLGRRQPKPGRPVVTGIDPVVQQAAETAMDALPAGAQAAMVVQRASTGEVVASVSRPVTTAFDLALDGQVPPGSTFKVITATALLEHGDTPGTTATCPPTLTVNGQVFRNFEGESSTTLSLAQAFAISCNTAFIGLASALPPAALPQAAGLYGLGHSVRPGLAVAGSSVPTPADANQLAGTAIGQAAVVVSPLALASVAAAVDSGAYRPPRLVAGAADDRVSPAALPAGIAEDLRSMMAGVVTGNGTAAGAGLPAGTSGKTGTAEFGSGPNPPTHAWFIGFRGDLAFSVFVYGGGVGGVVAAPLAARMLDGLPAGYDAGAGG